VPTWGSSASCLGRLSVNNSLRELDLRQTGFIYHLEDVNNLVTALRLNTSLTTLYLDKEAVCIDQDNQIEMALSQIDISLTENRELKRKKNNDLLSLAIILIQGFQQGCIPLPFDLIIQIFLNRTSHLNLKSNKNLILKMQDVHTMMSTIYNHPRPSKFVLPAITFWSARSAQDGFLETRHKSEQFDKENKCSIM